jgi:hypothetical protein
MILPKLVAESEESSDWPESERTRGGERVPSSAFSPPCSTTEGTTVDVGEGDSTAGENSTLSSDAEATKGEEIAAIKRPTVVVGCGTGGKSLETELSWSSSEEESESSPSPPPRILSWVWIVVKGTTLDSRRVLKGDKMRPEAVKYELPMTMGVDPLRADAISRQVISKGTALQTTLTIQEDGRPSEM